MALVLSKKEKRMQKKCFIFSIIILMVSLLLCSCSLDWWLGDGRGDWTVDLFEGYAVSKINSREIILVHKDDPDATGGSIILPNFFVTAYQLHNPYVCIEGFFMQGRSASDEKLKAMELNYYLLDTDSGELVGPFDSYDRFKEHTDYLSIKMSEEWVRTQK